MSTPNPIQPGPVPAVLGAILNVTRDIGAVGIAKDRRNQQQGYSFRGIDDVLNALNPLYVRHGLLVVPRMLRREVTERTTAKGGAMFHVVVEAEFIFQAAADGSAAVVRMFGEGMDSADKATNKAMSAAYKYAAFQTFAIPTVGDPDADATTPEESLPSLSAARKGELTKLAGEAMAAFSAGDGTRAVAMLMRSDFGPAERRHVWALIEPAPALRDALAHASRKDAQ